MIISLDVFVDFFVTNAMLFWAGMSDLFHQLLFIFGVRVTRVLEGDEAMKMKIFLIVALLCVGRIGYKTHYCGLSAHSLATLLQGDCSCSTADDWCTGGYSCSGGDYCDHTSWGCGTGFLFACNGRCWSQITGPRAEVQHSKPVRAVLWVSRKVQGVWRRPSAAARGAVPPDTEAHEQ